MLSRMRQTRLNFSHVLQALAHGCVGSRQLDALPAPSACGAKRIAGVDLQKPRMQAVASAVIGLAAAPDGFTVEQLAEQTKRHRRRRARRYGQRQAAYDLKKLRAKGLVERIPKTRRYRVRKRSIQTLVGWFILREKVIKPVLDAACRPRPGRPPNCPTQLDQDCRDLQRKMRTTLQHLHFAA